jgi:hypothetical protein
VIYSSGPSTFGSLTGPTPSSPRYSARASPSLGFSYHFSKIITDVDFDIHAIVEVIANEGNNVEHIDIVRNGIGFC